MRNLVDKIKTGEISRVANPQVAQIRDTVPFLIKTGEFDHEWRI